jgi:ankyrin repeat protein
MERAAMMKRLHCVVPTQNQPFALDKSLDSRISAALSVIMPEEHDGQHQALQTNHLKLELYLLSNGLAFHDTYISTETIAAQDNRLLKMVRSLRWHSVSHLKALLASKEPTAEAITEKLFASAIRLVDTRIVNAFLKAGMDTNRAFDTAEDMITPLAWAANVDNDKGLELCELLISFGACVNLAHRGETALLHAIRKNNTGVIGVLRRHGAVIDLECLAAAASVVDIELFDDLLKSCNRPSGLYYEEIKKRSVVKGQTTLLGAAAKSGRMQVIERVLQNCPDLVCPKAQAHLSSYLSPLLIAVELSRTNILQPLIDAGVTVETVNGCPWTLIERALAHYNLEACRILIENGARIYRPLSYRELQTLVNALSACHPPTRIIDQMIMLAKSKDHFPEWSASMLAVAIEEANHALIGQLLAAGVNIGKAKVSEIKDVATASYLDKAGVLGSVLETSGATILLTALGHGSLQLAWWLINRVAHILDSKLYSRRTPLSIAARKGDLSMVEELMRRGSRVSDRELVEAVHHVQNEGGNIDVLRRLLVDFQGCAPSAVALAGFGQRLDLLQLLLSKGADPAGVPMHPWEAGWTRPHDGDDRLITPVHNPHSALEIVAAGGDASALEAVTQSSLCHWSPELVGRALALAINSHGDGLVERLLQLGPNMNEEITVDEGAALSCWLECMPYDEELEIYTALEAAVKKQNVPVVRRLLEFGDININHHARGARGRTALQHAVETGNWELISILLSRGADVNGRPAEDAGATALQLAAIKGYLPLAGELIRRGADVNAPRAPWKGRTALEGAAEHGRIDMVHLLLEHGALIQGRFGRRQYDNALRMAREKGHYATARVLESFRAKLGPVEGGIVEDSSDNDGSEDSEDSEVAVYSSHAEGSEGSDDSDDED